MSTIRLSGDSHGDFDNDWDNIKIGRDRIGYIGIICIYAITVVIYIVFFFNNKKINARRKSVKQQVLKMCCTLI